MGRGRACKRLISVVSSFRKGFGRVHGKMDETVKALNDIKSTSTKIYHSVEALRGELKAGKGMPEQQHLQVYQEQGWKNGHREIMKPTGDWRREKNITIIERDVTRVISVSQGMDIAKVFLDQLQRLTKLPVPIDSDVLLYVSIAVNLAANESVQEVSLLASNYLQGKVTHMELKMAFKKFIEANPVLQVMCKVALYFVQAFWPVIVVMICTRTQTLGLGTDIPTATSGCPFAEGCHLFGNISITKYNYNPVWASTSFNTPATPKSSICGSVPQGPRDGCDC